MITPLEKKVSEWVWNRCPGCGRYSKYCEPPWFTEKRKEHPDWEWKGEYHADGCPLQGLYGHQHRWWFEREIERLEKELEEAKK